MEKIRVDVWSDIACPWCYVGKRRLEGALARLPDRDRVEVVWRAFELDPSAPRVRPSNGSYAERLATKYRMSVAQAEQRIQGLVDVAAADGLEFRFDRIRPGNTFDAHRLLHLAHERGMQDAVKERFLRGYMTEGEPIGEPEALTRMAADAGLDPDEVAGLLASDQFAKEVRADEAAAAELGIQGVPFFVLGGRYAISGAQPVEAFTGAFERVLAEGARPAVVADGAACGPDGCG